MYWEVQSYEQLAAHDALWQPLASIVRNFFCNPHYTPMMQLILSLVYGLLLAPWGSGLFFLVVFIFFYEIAFYTFTHGNPLYYDLSVRAGVICSAILGWIIGRSLSQDDILCPGIP